LYAHMNNKTIKIKKQQQQQTQAILSSIIWDWDMGTWRRGYPCMQFR
jgi:hypothetical protein